MEKENKATKIVHWIQLLLVGIGIIYAFTFSTFHIHQAGLPAKFLNFKMPFINGILLYLVLALGLMLSLLKQIISKQYYQATRFDGLFIAYCSYHALSLFWVKDVGLGLAALVTSLSFYAFYFLLNDLLAQHKTTTIRWISYLLFALTASFILYFFVYNIEVLMKFVHTDSSFQKIITQSKSWVGSKNQTACFLALLLPIIALLNQQKWITISLMAVVSMHILIMGSRNAYIALLVFFTIYLLFNKINRKQLLILTILAAAVGLIFVQFIGFEIFINQLKNNTWSSRFLFWSQTVQMGFDHWLLGIGAGQWDVFRLQYDVWHSYRHPHNDFIRNFAELGITGFLLFYSLIGATLFMIIKNFKYDKKLAIVALAAIAVYLSLSFFDELKMKDNYNLLLALIVTLVNEKLTSFKLPTTNYKPLHFVFTLFICVSVVFLIIHPNLLQQEIQHYKNYRMYFKQKEKELGVNELKLINQHVVKSIDRNPIPVLIANSYFNMRNLDSAKVYFKKVADSYPFYINELKGSLHMSIVYNKKARAWHQYARIHFLNPCNSVLEDEGLEMPEYKKASYYQNIVNEQRATCKQVRP